MRMTGRAKDKDAEGHEKIESAVATSMRDFTFSSVQFSFFAVPPRSLHVEFRFNDTGVAGTYRYTQHVTCNGITHDFY
jgi:hypothetical protein